MMSICRALLSLPREDLLLMAGEWATSRNRTTEKAIGGAWANSRNRMTEKAIGPSRQVNGPTAETG